MSQKINPKIIKLGIKSKWFINIQKYGNNFNIFRSFYFFYIKSLNLIFNLFKRQNTFINEIEIKHKNNMLDFIIIYNNKISKKKELIHKLFLNLNFFFYSTNLIKIKIYNTNTKFYNLNILFLYIYYLYKNLNYNIKKIIAIISILLKNNLNSKLIIKFKNGPKNIILKGFKITFKGRLSNQKNNMSKTITIKKGSLKLNSLNNYIEFKNIPLHTKLGICNLKIWLFFIIK